MFFSLNALVLHNVQCPSKKGFFSKFPGDVSHILTVRRNISARHARTLGKVLIDGLCILAPSIARRSFRRAAAASFILSRRPLLSSALALVVVVPRDGGGAGIKARRCFSISLPRRHNVSAQRITFIKSGFFIFITASLGYDDTV